MAEETTEIDTYNEAVSVCITLLDNFTQKDLVAGWGAGTYERKTRLFLDLGIPPERMAVLAPATNELLQNTPTKGKRKVSNSEMAKCTTLGSYFDLFCDKAKIENPNAGK